MMKVTEALGYLAETDERLGQLKGAAKYYADFKVKKIKGELFLQAKGSKDERESQAFTNPVYQTIMEEKRELDIELETIIAKRKTCELTVEVWRSQNANRRQGNI